MNLEPSSEQRQVLGVVRDFVRARVAPAAGTWDEAGAIPAAAWAGLGELGLPGVDVPEDQGGAGLDAVAAVLAVEELAVGSGSLAASLVSHLVAGFALRTADPIVAIGQQLAAGGLRAATVLTAGFTSSLAVTSAGGRSTVTGEARFVAGAEVADGFILPARDAEGGLRLVTLPRGKAGLSGEAEAHPLGLRALGLGRLRFDAVEMVTGDALTLSPEGAARVRDYARLLGAAILVGLGRMALEEASRYALERKAFGQPIAELASIQHKIADAATLLDGARLVTWRAAAQLARGRGFTREAGVARLQAARAAALATDESLQIFGGYGYTEDFPVERAWRDAKVVSIDEGATDAPRADVAREIHRLIT